MTMSKKEYRKAYAEDERNQYLDCGASFDFSKPCKNAKANFLVSVMAKMHIGYKLEYKNLACKRWTKWVKESPSFKSSELLNPSDVKSAVKEFYRLVSIGELSWADGQKRQLEFTRSIDGLMELRVIGYVDGYFADSSKAVNPTDDVPENAESIQSEAVVSEAVEADEIDVMATLEAILKGNISEIEREIVGKAMASLILASKKTA